MIFNMSHEVLTIKTYDAFHHLTAAKLMHLGYQLVNTSLKELEKNYQDNCMNELFEESLLNRINDL